MQTRKRARPVKFGVKDEPKVETVKEPEEVVEEKKHHVVHHHEEEQEHPKKNVSHQEIVELPEDDDDERRIGPIIISQNVNVDQATDKDEEPKTTFTSFTEAKKEDTSTSSVQESAPVITQDVQEESEPEEIAAETEVSPEEIEQEAAREEEEPICEPVKIAPEPDAHEPSELNPFRQDRELEEEPPTRRSAFFTREGSGFGRSSGESAFSNNNKKPEEVANDEPPMDPRDSYFSNEEEGSGKGKSSFVFFLKVVFITFVLGILAIGALSYFSGGKSFSFDSMESLLSFDKSTPTPTEKPEEPTPTEEPVDAGAYTITIQNGSGVTGEAAKLKTGLAEEGFNVTGTGNADNSDYTSTQISAKESVSDGYLEKLKSDLGQNYKVADAILPAQDSQSTDVLIIIGSDTN